MLEDGPKRINCYCISTSNNNIVCGLIEKYSSNKTNYYTYNHSFVLLDNNNENIIDKKVINSSFEKVDYKDEYENNKVFVYKFFKLIPLEEDKIFYCYLNEVGYCGLIQIKDNSKIEELITPKKIFNSLGFYSNLVRDSISAVKHKANEIRLSLFDEQTIYMINVTINDNVFWKGNKEIKFVENLNDKYPHFGKLLKNNNDNLIFMIVYGKYDGTNLQGYFEEIDYSKCSDTSISVYNGEKTKLSFKIIPSVLNDNNNQIIFLNGGKGVNSLLNGYSSIIEGNAYLQNNIYFNLSSKDYNYIKNNNKYEIEFTNSLDQKFSQRCKLTVSFKKCSTECEYCTLYKCWDKYWNEVKQKEEPKPKKPRTDLQTYFFILPASILVMLIVLIFFTFVKCCGKNKLDNYGGNLVQNEMPLIS